MDPVDYALARTILGIEAQRWRYGGVKLNHIREVTGLSGTQYALRLHELVTDPDPALAAEFPEVYRRARARIETKMRLATARGRRIA